MPRRTGARRTWTPRMPPPRRPDAVAADRGNAAPGNRRPDYPAGARLPTEAELSARFAVNRHTVRRALEELSRGGLIRVEQGRGTFVAEDVLDYTVGPRTRFTEWIHRHNKEPSGRVLQRARNRRRLGHRRGARRPPRARVVLLERLGLADDTPVSLARHYFPPPACAACWRRWPPRHASPRRCEPSGSRTTSAR